MESFVDILLKGEIDPLKTMLIPVDSYPSVVSTVINRVQEELDINDFIIVTRRETAEIVKNVMGNVSSTVNIYFDNILFKSLLKDNVFENLFIIGNLIKGIRDRLSRIYIDISASS
ncbi:MAG: hypothetical protein QXS26_01655, partial [Thermosphaera sp.]